MSQTKKAAAIGLCLALAKIRTESARAAYDLRVIHVLADTGIYFLGRMVNVNTDVKADDLRRELSETELMASFQECFDVITAEGGAG